MRKLLLLSIFLLLVSIVMPQDLIASEYKLNIDDRLYISVWGHEDLQQEVLVNPDGNINFPLMGDLKVEGLTIKEVSAIISEKLSKYINLDKSQVSVILRDYKKVRAMVLGEVKNPATYQLTPGSRVLDLISLAGGTTEIADLSNLKLTRGEQNFTIDLEKLLEGDNIDQNYLIEENDVLYISDVTIEVNIIGEVNKAGRYKLKKGLTISDLIAQAGGMTDDASNKAEYIVNGIKRKVDLDKALSSESGANLNLEDGATLYIKKDSFNLSKLSFWRNFFFFVGGLNQLNDLVNN